jgi:hypothetical protein
MLPDGTSAPQSAYGHLGGQHGFYEDVEGFFDRERNRDRSMAPGPRAYDVARSSAGGCFLHYHSRDLPIDVCVARSAALVSL